MIKFVCVAFIFSLSLMAAAQTIRGTITDQDGAPVSDVHLFCNQQSVGAVSDGKGHYSFNLQHACDSVTISHVHYGQQRFPVSALIKQPDIMLGDVFVLLRTVDIFDKPVITLLPDTALFINDYEIADQRIWLCAFTHRSPNKPNLLLTDLNGDILDSRALEHTGDLYRDPENSMYIMQKTEAFMLSAPNDSIVFSDSFDAEYIINAREHWTHTSGDSLILKYYYYRNQGLAYYVRVLPEDSAHLWLEFVDEDAYDRMAMGPYFDGNEFDRRFEELIVYKPVQIPVFLNGDSLIVFNFITHTIQYMDKSGTLAYEKNMDWCQTSHMKPEIYRDDFTGKFYGREVRNGLNKLIEIDIRSGKALQTYVFKGYPHIEKLRVYDGTLYFIYFDYAGDQYKRLYKSPLIRMTAG